MEVSIATLAAVVVISAALSYWSWKQIKQDIEREEFLSRLRDSLAPLPDEWTP